MKHHIPTTRSLLLACLALLTLPVLAQPTPPAPPPAPATPPPLTSGNFGKPLLGATTTQLAAFNQGSRDFNIRETRQTGLGPIFNDDSCLACHGAPSAGGSSGKTVTRFGHSANGVFNPLTSLDGSLLHARAIDPSLQEVVPAEANVVARRLTTPLYGAGLIEAIPDATIIANANLPKPAGVKGHVALVTDVATGESRVGRFGWKAQHATLLVFSGDALNNEIGITIRLFPKAAAPNGDETNLARFVSPTAPIEDQPDANGLSAIDRMSTYMRFLAPPAGAPTTPATLAGQKLFASIGCASCHTPSLNTGPNAITALANKNVQLYSDLLLHDMGTLGDGIAQAAAGTTEMRTSPLWGLNARHSYLHDGRAATPAAAVLAHAGEAAASQSAYAQLTPAQQQQLIAFLRSL